MVTNSVPFIPERNINEILKIKTYSELKPKLTDKTLLFNFYSSIPETNFLPRLSGTTLQERENRLKLVEHSCKQQQSLSSKILQSFADVQNKLKCFTQKY